MFWKTVAGNQFMQGTLPHIIRTVENLSNNIGRLAMASEKRNEALSIGGDIKYLKFLVENYGGNSSVAEVALNERARLASQKHEEVEGLFDLIDPALKPFREMGSTDDQSDQ